MWWPLGCSLTGMQACLASLDGVTPTCIRAAYGLDNDTDVAGGADGGQAFIVNQAFAPSDLAKFQSECALARSPIASSAIISMRGAVLCSILSLAPSSCF